MFQKKVKCLNCAYRQRLSRVVTTQLFEIGLPFPELERKLISNKQLEGLKSVLDSEDKDLVCVQNLLARLTTSNECLYKELVEERECFKFKKFETRHEQMTGDGIKQEHEEENKKAIQNDEWTRLIITTIFSFILGITSTVIKDNLKQNHEKSTVLSHKKEKENEHISCSL